MQLRKATSGPGQRQRKAKMSKQAPLAPGQRNSCPEACRTLVRYWPPLIIAAAHAELLKRSCWAVHAQQALVRCCPCATCCTDCRMLHRGSAKLVTRNTLGGAGTSCSCTACMSALSLCSGNRVYRHLDRRHQLLASNLAALELRGACERCQLPHDTAPHTCRFEHDEQQGVTTVPDQAAPAFRYADTGLVM